MDGDEFRFTDKSPACSADACGTFERLEAILKELRSMHLVNKYRDDFLNGRSGQMEHVFEDDGDVHVFITNLNEIGISVNPTLRDGYSAFTPATARRIAAALLKLADDIERPAAPRATP